jgi:hypothetical protein
MIKVLRNPTDETTALTSCHGYIETTYQDLVDRFGEPTFEDHDPREKVNAESTIGKRDGFQWVNTIGTLAAMTHPSYIYFVSMRSAMANQDHTSRERLDNEKQTSIDNSNIFFKILFY